MTDVYSGHSQFVLLTDNRRRWFDGRTIFLITVVTLPVIIFCGIYTIILKSNESLLYPKSTADVPPLWSDRVKSYSDHPKNFKSNTYNNRHIHLPIENTFQETDEFKLVCYYNFPRDRQTGLQPESLDPFLCTHINVGFTSIVNNSIQIEDADLDVLKTIVDLKKINNNLKVLITVGGADDDAGFSEMVLNHTNRKTFIKSVLDLVKHQYIDGVDLDWEFPNRVPGPDKFQKLHFTQLLEEFRKTINKQTKHKFIITVAVAAPPILIDQCYDVPYINQLVDFVNVMTYDYHFYTKVTPFTGLNSPLYQCRDDKGYFKSLNINYTIHYWMFKGMDRDKIVVGLPTFGHTFRLTNIHNKDLYAPARGYGKLGSGGFADYTQICKFLTMNQINPVFNVETKSPYASKSTEWVSFETEQSLAFKAEYVRNMQLGGAMVYALNADDYMGKCNLDSRIESQPFPLIRKIREILDKNYSIM